MTCRIDKMEQRKLNEKEGGKSEEEEDGECEEEEDECEEEEDEFEEEEDGESEEEKMTSNRKKRKPRYSEEFRDSWGSWDSPTDNSSDYESPVDKSPALHSPPGGDLSEYESPVATPSTKDSLEDDLSEYESPIPLTSYFPPVEIPPVIPTFKELLPDSLRDHSDESAKDTSSENRAIALSNEERNMRSSRKNSPELISSEEAEPHKDISLRIQPPLEVNENRGVERRIRKRPRKAYRRMYLHTKYSQSRKSSDDSPPKTEGGEKRPLRKRPRQKRPCQKRHSTLTTRVVVVGTRIRARAHHRGDGQPQMSRRASTSGSVRTRRRAIKVRDYSKESTPPGTSCSLETEAEGGSNVATGGTVDAHHDEISPEVLIEEYAEVEVYTESNDEALSSRHSEDNSVIDVGMQEDKEETKEVVDSSTEESSGERERSKRTKRDPTDQ